MVEDSHGSFREHRDSYLVLALADAEVENF